MLNNDNTEVNHNINQTSLVTFCSLLAISKQIDSFSQLLTVLAIGIGIIVSWCLSSLPLVILSCLVFIVGVLGKYFALRLCFDKNLFDYLVNHIEHLPKNLVELDEALVKLNLIKSDSVPSRSINDRQYGTLKLLQKQVIILIIQVLLLILTLFLGIFFH